MNTPELSYINWAKAMPDAAVNLARSGIDYCPPSLLRLRASDLVTQLPVRYGYAPLREAIAARYGVAFDQVFTLSGGTSLANWVACAAALTAGREAPRSSSSGRRTNRCCRSRACWGTACDVSTVALPMGTRSTSRAFAGWCRAAQRSAS